MTPHFPVKFNRVSSCIVRLPGAIIENCRYSWTRVEYRTIQLNDNEITESTTVSPLLGGRRFSRIMAPPLLRACTYSMRFCEKCERHMNRPEFFYNFKFFILFFSNFSLIFYIILLKKNSKIYVLIDKS